MVEATVIQLTSKPAVRRCRAKDRQQLTEDSLRGASQAKAAWRRRSRSRTSARHCRAIARKAVGYSAYGVLQWCWQARQEPRGGFLWIEAVLVTS